MTLKLVTYPDPILKTQCAIIPEVTEEIQQLAWEMRDLMVASNGIGIAASQVGKSIRLFVVDIWWPQTGNTDAALTFINPVLTLGNGTQKREEGCLSLPGVREWIPRADSIVVKAQGIDGESFTMEVGGFLAVAIQHENDHLNGVTMMDRMGPTARRLARKKLRS